MANAFTLFGEISVNTNKFMRDMDNAQKRLESFKNALDKVERSTSGTGSASSANEKYASSANKAAAGAKNFSSALNQTSSASKTSANSLNALSSKLGTMGERFKSLGVSATAGLTAPLGLLGRSLLESGKDMDSMMNQLVMATGSMEGASAKFKELLAVANSSAGVFASTAVGMYGLIKPSVQSDAVITSLVIAMGKLKTAFSEMDVRNFVWNMTQIFNQGMEIMDLKQAFNFFPRFGEVIADKFKIDGTSAEAIQPVLQFMRKSGQLTMESWLGAFAEAVNKDPRFALLTETLGNRITKAIDQIKISGAPIGKIIGNILVGALMMLDKVLKDLSARFEQMSPAMQYFIVIAGMLAAAIGPVIYLFGTLAGAIDDLIGLGVTLAPAFAKIGTVIAGVTAVGFAKVLAIILAVVGTLYVLYNAISLAADWWNSNVDGMKGYAQQLFDTLDKIAGDIYYSLESTFKQISEDIGDEWKDFVMTAIILAKYLWERSVSIIQTMLNILKYLWDNYGKDIIAGIKRTVQILAVIFQGIFTFLHGLLKVFVGIFTGNWSMFLDGLGKLIVGFGKTLVGLVAAVFNGIYTGISNFIAGVVSMFVGSQKPAEEAGRQFGASTGKGIIDGLLESVPFINKIRKLLSGETNFSDTFKFDIPTFDFPKIDVGALGKGKGAGKTDSRQEASEAVKQLEEELARLGITTKLGNAELDIQLNKYKNLTPEIQKQILATAGLIDAKNKEIEALQLKEQIDKDVKSSIDELRIATEKLGAVDEDQIALIELSSEKYKDWTQTQKEAYLEAVRSYNFSKQQQEQATSITKGLEDIIKLTEKETTATERYNAILQELSKTAIVVNEEFLEKAKVAAIAYDAEQKMAKGTQALTELMDELGMSTEKNRTFMQQLGDLWVQFPETFAEIAKKIGIEVDELKKKLEGLAGEKDKPTFLGSFEKRMGELRESVGTFAEGFADIAIMAFNGVGDVFANAVREWDGTFRGFFKSLGKGFRELVTEVVAQLMRLLVMQAIMSLFGNLFGSLAGGNANGFFGRLSASMGNPVKAATGGLIRGAGTGTSDSIPAMLSNGEYVIPASAVRKFGVNFFDALRFGEMPMPTLQMAGGGMVGGASNSTTNNSNVFNINVTGGGGSGQTATMIQQEVLKGLRKTEKRNR